MLGAINFIIGIALAAGKVLLSPSEVAVNSVKQFFMKLGIGLTDADSEFVGDASQGLIAKVADAINKHREYHKLKVFFENNLKDLSLEGEGEINLENKIGKIFNDIKYKREAEENKRNNKPIKPQKKQKEEKRQKFDMKVLTEISADLVFFHADAIAYLKEYSTSFKNLYEQEDTREWAESFAQLIDITVDVHIKRVFYNSSDDLKVLAYIFAHEFKDYEATKEITLNDEQLKELSNDLIQKFLPYLANQNGGVIDFQAVANAKYAPKYIKNACPGCGYDGDRILVDEKTGTVKCAACGKSYDLVQYAEPEIYAEIVKKVEAGLENDEAIKKIANESAADVKEIKKQLTVYYSQSLTKNYLEACLKGQADQFHNDLVTLREDNNKFQDDFKKRFTEIEADFSSLQKGQQGLQQGQQDLKKGQAQLLENSKDILDFLKKKTEEDRQVVGHFSQKLDSLDKQVNSLYEYAKEMFPELSGKSDLILEYVQKLCSKEYYEEMSNALGTDINKAISMEMKNGYEHIQALNSTSVSQIISAIEDLKKDCAKEGGVDQKIIEDSIRNANVQLSGKIVGLQELINSCNESNKASFRTIIEKLDDIRALQLGTSTVKGFENIYLGNKLPYKYLPNKGFKNKSFPCFFCGADAVEVNDYQMCSCKVCGNIYAEIEPFYIEEAQGKGHLTRFEKDELPLPDKIKKWRDEHTARVISNGSSCMLALTDDSLRDKLVILPENLGVSIHSLLWYDYKDVDQIETIVFPSSITNVAGLDFSLKSESDVNYIYLKNIVFACDEQGRYRLKPNQHLTVSRDMNVYGKYSNGKNIKLNII